jgi:membrane associated rhomboid family serine protease
LAWNPQQQYQRPRMSGFSMFPPGIKFLLGSNIAVYLLELLFGDLHFSGGATLRDAIVENFALWPLNSGHFLPWQLFTYMFLHEGFMHIFFNMLMLFWVGVQVEQAWGTKRFLIYYFVCGLGGATAHLLLSGFFGMASGPMLGASGAIFGVLVAFGVMFPDMRLIFFPIFIPIRAKFVVPILIAFEVYSTYNASDGDNVAHLAHLGGAVTGMIYLLIMSGGKILASRRGRVQSQWTNGSAKVPGNGSFFGRKPGGVVDADYRDVDNHGGTIADTKIQDVKQAKVITQEEIDRILDKIAATGYQNLTETERDILFEASRRMEEKK